jgi:hypothetical protein
MSNKVVWTLPFLSTLMFEKRLSEKGEGLIVSLYLRGFNDEEDREYKVNINFITTMCYLHSSVRFPYTGVHYDNSYEQIIILNDSWWLKKIEEINKSEYLYWKLKHYAIYFHDDGMYEFLAQDVEVFVDGERVELLQ